MMNFLTKIFTVIKLLDGEVADLIKKVDIIRLDGA